MIIEPKEIDLIWPKVWPLIQDIVVLESQEQLIEELRKANRFLLVIGDGAAIIRPCDNFLEINYVGGKNAKQWWGAMSQAIDSSAIALDKKRVVAFGRNAWKRLAPDYAATETRMYIKEVA